MRKIRLKEDINVPGWGIVRAGTEFKVEKYNSKYIYVKLGLCSLKLSRGQTETLY